MPMPSIPAPEHIMDEPEGGWPWQLQYCWVMDKKGLGNSIKYKVMCKCCGWSPSHTDRVRVGLHYRGVKGALCRCNAALTLWRAQVRV